MFFFRADSIYKHMQASLQNVRAAYLPLSWINWIVLLFDFGMVRHKKHIYHNLFYTVLHAWFLQMYFFVSFMALRAVTDDKIYFVDDNVQLLD